MIKAKLNVDKDILDKKHQEEKEQENQKRLREKHNLKEDDKKIVEVNVFQKLVLKSIIGFIKFIASAIIVSLSSLGLLTIIYTKPREEILVILMEIYNQMTSIFN